MKRLLTGACVAVLLSCGCADGARRAISTDQAPKAIGPYSQAIEAGNFLFLAGQIAIDPATQNFIAGTIDAQTARVMKNLEAVLRAADLGFEDVVKTTVYLTDLGDFPAMNAVYALSFTQDPPARATVQVAALPKGAKVEIEAVALRKKK